MDASRLKRLDMYVSRQVESGKAPYFQVAVAHKGRECYLSASGTVGNRPFDDRTIWRAFSMTKPITQTAVMMCYEEALFDLDDPIHKYIPEFKDIQVFTGGDADNYTAEPARRPITIKHLLTHTAGITGNFLADSPPVTDLYIRNNITWLRPADSADQKETLADVVKRLAQLPLVSHPGEEWHYGDCLAIAGYLVEVVSGMSYRNFLLERIFSPLGMTDTDFFVPEEKEAWLCDCFAVEGLGMVRGAQEEEPSKMPSFRVVDSRSNSAMTKRRHSGIWGGESGLVTTTHDYLRFLVMLTNKGALDGARLLGRKTVEYMMMNHLGDERLNQQFNSTMTQFQAADFLGTNRSGQGYSLLGSVVISPASYAATSSLGENAWGGAASCYWWVDPQEELCVLQVSQLVPSRVHNWRRELHPLVYQALESLGDSKARL